MGTDAPTPFDTFRAAVESHARSSLARTPRAAADLTALYHRSLLFVFRNSINSAPRDPNSILAAAEHYAAFLALVPRTDASGFRLDPAPAARRKNSGAYYTPLALVHEILDAAIDPLLAPDGEPASADAILALRILDPACGVGHFLLPAAQRLAAALARVRAAPAAPTPDQSRAALIDVTRACIFGADIDPTAAALCRTALCAQAGLDPSKLTLDPHIRAADSLAPAAHPSPLNAVIGNPPFVNAIEGGIHPRTRARLRAAFPELGPLADLSHYFLALAVRLVRPGGRIGLVLPRPILGAGAAANLRAKLPPHLRPTLLHALPTARLFASADVHICTIALGPDPACRIGLPAPAGATRWRTAPITDTNWWRAMQSARARAPSQATPRLGDLFEVRSSMFIHDAYALRPHIIDAEHAPGPKLITTGLIDPAECLWGRTPCRYLGRRFRFPRVLAAPDMPPSLARRLAAARRPKILIAGLAGRIECFLDATGECMGSVGTYAVFDPADDPRRLEGAARTLLSPAASRLFRDTLGANALSGGNVGLRLGFLRDLPLHRPPARPAPRTANGTPSLRRVRPVP